MHELRRRSTRYVQSSKIPCEGPGRGNRIGTADNVGLCLPEQLPYDIYTRHRGHEHSLAAYILIGHDIWISRAGWAQAPVERVFLERTRHLRPREVVRQHVVGYRPVAPLSGDAESIDQHKRLRRWPINKRWYRAEPVAEAGAARERH